MAEQTEQANDPTAAQDGAEHPELAAIAESLEPEPGEASQTEPMTGEAALEDAGEVSADAELPAEEPAQEPAEAEQAAEEPSEELSEEPSPQEQAQGSVGAEPAAEEASGRTEALGAHTETGAIRSPDEVPWLPFAVYLGLWVVFAGVVVWRFYDVPQGQAVYESSLYPLSVFGGTALTVAGPLLSLATWIAAWGAPGSTKWGQFVSAFVKGSLVTAVGVVLWWMALVIVDQLRLGRVL